MLDQLTGGRLELGTCRGVSALEAIYIFLTCQMIAANGGDNLVEPLHPGNLMYLRARPFWREQAA